MICLPLEFSRLDNLGAFSMRRIVGVIAVDSWRHMIDRLLLIQQNLVLRRRRLLPPELALGNPEAVRSIGVIVRANRRRLSWYSRVVDGTSIEWRARSTIRQIRVRFRLLHLMLWLLLLLTLALRWCIGHLAALRARSAALRRRVIVSGVVRVRRRVYGWRAV